MSPRSGTLSTKQAFVKLCISSISVAQNVLTIPITDLYQENRCAEQAGEPVLGCPKNLHRRELD